MQRKGKRNLLIAGVVVLVVVGGLGGALLFTEGERREAKNVPIKDINFKSLSNGTYVGEYEGGKFKMRANKIQVTVSAKKVTEIKVLEQKEKRASTFTEELFGRVIQAQSLQVDTISGATLTSKAFLKGIEDALEQASHS
ncbi:FMN-binding protein [Gorillibacterium sp. CAU 1737]|uniref:FMN-binding protein n=1 Tax=Gorillibacterium sp. CAU 1737 TaxID=3140362 RepID=UPI003260B5C7